MLIAIEGVDKSGKETQANLLLERMQRECRNARKIEFPNYRSEASAAVKMYLNGDFGKNPDDVNPYAASLFFAVDRYASYKTEWGAFHNAGGIIIADRYTMSNMIHQGAKFPDAHERRKFIDWLIDLEFKKIGLPEPDVVIFLDLSMELRVQLLEKEPATSPSTTRKTSISSEATTQKSTPATENKIPHDTPPLKRGADIHEQDLGYLRRAHDCAREIAAQLGWKCIDAGRDGALRPALEIHEDLYNIIAPII